MIKFLTFAVKLQLNVHDLNNEAVAGNVSDIRIMEFLDEEGSRIEAPAVSGRMLKHWHYEGMRHLVSQEVYSNVDLCAGCKAGEPIRPAIIKDGRLTQVAISEQNAITSCAICDIHGYLIAQEVGGEQERGISARRTSRAMFSWLMPVLGTEFSSKQVIHNRVSADPNFMMPFNKSYASGIYAFVSALDVERIGLVELNLGSNNAYAVNDNNARKDRIKVAIESYRYLLSGQMGASLSHAIPHCDPIELLVAYSENTPLPFPVSPIYADYINKNKGLMPNGTILLFWNSKGETIEGITTKEKIDDIFKELISKV